MCDQDKALKLALRASSLADRVAAPSWVLPSSGAELGMDSRICDVDVVEEGEGE